MKKFHISCTSLLIVMSMTVATTAQDITEKSHSPTEDETIGKPIEVEGDDEEIEALVLSVQKELDQPKEDLAKHGRELATKLIASFHHDLDIARADQRRRRLEQARASIVAIAEEDAAERRKLFQQMKDELERTRQQLSDDPDICEQEQILVIKTFRERMQELKDHEDECRDKAEKTSNTLTDLRRDKIRRERKRDLAKLTPLARPLQSHSVPDFTWVKMDNPNKVESTSKETPIPSNIESIESALESVNRLVE
ncbi:hypothetical protein Mal35_16910 [Gimesia maris]|uniref:hypothetical protein n=1 Tax=Gimesia maris TaxID=122 RepID=UPI00118824C9|nr:hypothetical protein [Gimesia maris]QDT78259.1 hypothetical protein Mal35_16910 [Gimesia maris]